MNEATSRQASKQTQSVLAGEATSRQASKHSRCKHNLDDAASADTHWSSPGPQEWETNESASWYKLSTTSPFFTFSLPSTCLELLAYSLLVREEGLLIDLCERKIMFLIENIVHINSIHVRELTSPNQPAAPAEQAASLLTCVFIAVKYLSMQGLACRLAASACSRQQPWPMIYMWTE